jgi:hypothetical protein
MDGIVLANFKKRISQIVGKYLLKKKNLFIYFVEINGRFSGASSCLPIVFESRQLAVEIEETLAYGQKDLYVLKSSVNSAIVCNG